MDTKTLVIHCSYSEEGASIAQIIRESFLFFLKKEMFGLDVRQEGVVLQWRSHGL